MTSEHDDHELLRHASRGDQEAARELYRRHAPPLLRFLTLMLGDRHAAEDVLQNAFLYLFQKAADYDSKRAALSTYLHVIARNYARNELRRRARKPAAPLEALETVIPAREISRNPDAMQIVLEKLPELPEDDREILILRYTQGMKPREIAGILEISSKTASARIYRAVKRLQEIL